MNNKLVSFLLTFSCSIFLFPIVSNAQFFQEDNSYIGIGHGFPSVFKDQFAVLELYSDVQSSSIGPISLNYELGIHKYVGIFVQADIANLKTSFDFLGLGEIEEINLFYYGLQARIVGHYPNVKKIDPYVAIGMGYHSIKFDFIGINFPATSPSLIMGALGVNFHFETNFSGYFEFSSGITPLTLGLRMKI